MKEIITKFDDETGDFDVVTPIPFTLNDGIEVLGMMVADIPKYEDTETYNVFELIRENQELKKQLSNSHQIKAQQREFIEYLNKYIKERRRLSKLHKKYSLSEERLSAQCHVLENVLLKYKEIIGGLDEQ